MKSGHAVLLLHGLGGGPAELLYLRRRLKEQGYHVEVPLLPGHCTHYTQLRKYTWRDYAEAAYAEFEKLEAQYETVSLSGLCMGSVLALCIAIKYGDRVKAICPVSTTLNYDGWGLPWYTKFIVLAPYTPCYWFMNIGEGDPYGVKDETIRKWIKSKMSNKSTTHYSKVPLGSVWQMRQMNFYVKKNLHKITSPICAIHPLEDDVSSIKSVEDMRRGVSSKIFESLILQDSYHLATVDREKALVADSILAFLKKTHESGALNASA